MALASDDAAASTCFFSSSPDTPSGRPLMKTGNVAFSCVTLMRSPHVSSCWKDSAASCAYRRLGT